MSEEPLYTATATACTQVGAVPRQGRRRVAQLATRQRLLHLSSPSLRPPTTNPGSLARALLLGGGGQGDGGAREGRGGGCTGVPRS